MDTMGTDLELSIYTPTRVQNIPKHMGKGCPGTFHQSQAPWTLKH